MAVPERSLSVEIPQESREAAPSILVEGLEYEIDLDPVVVEHYTEMTPPSLEDPLADFERLRRALSAKGMEVTEVGRRTLLDGSGILRLADWRVTTGVWNSRRLIRMQAGDTAQSSHGAAVDIGTTTIVVYLVDMTTGRTVAHDSSLNPQIPYGEDVISRLAYCGLGRRQARLLNRLVIDEISRLISSCCRQIRAKRDDVLDMCMVGNTVMHHIALGLPTGYLGLSPFPPVVRRGVNTDASALGLKLHPDTPVHALPTLAGYVGADTCGVILSSRIYEAKETSMAIDIGTNGEIILGDRNGLTVCSCAAGPALEGAHMKFGMRAADGAIQRVRIDGDEVSIRTIGDVPPVGIAGAGIIDSVAEMLRDGAIGADGRLREHPRVRTSDGVKEFLLVEADEAGVDGDIVITQRDVRGVQLAKAAMLTGALTLMEYAGKSPDEISMFYVAGAFGNYIDFAKAKLIGLVPDIPLERLKFIGNGAAAGAKLALLSRSLREVSEHVADRVQYVELTCSADFTRNYMDATYMPHRDPSRFSRTPTSDRDQGGPA